MTLLLIKGLNQRLEIKVRTTLYNIIHGKKYCSVAFDHLLNGHTMGHNWGFEQILKCENRFTPAKYILILAKYVLIRVQVILIFITIYSDAVLTLH